MFADAKFLFVICQVGAESALKGEIARTWPALRFAFSRPGFVTFKLPAGLKLSVDFDPGCTLARTWGFSVGKIQVESAETGAPRLWKLVDTLKIDALHIWQRDAALPGDRGFEPGRTPLAEQVGAIVAAARPTKASLPVNQAASVGDVVLDCVLVEPNEWWVGWHVVQGTASQWPGGVPPIKAPTAVVSRAYFKIAEALAWSRLPIKVDDHCAEIGCAPGGAAQALLERKLFVLGIDPAEMDDAILTNPRFTHAKRRAADMRRREFRQIKWLFADSNVPPTQTLSNVEAIVTHREVHIRGMALTLKLTDWKLVEAIPAWVDRVRSWGYDRVETRQLAFNRREICLAAIKSRRQSK